MSSKDAQPSEPLETSYSPPPAQENSATSNDSFQAQPGESEDDALPPGGVDKVVLSRKNGVIFARSMVDDYKMRPTELEGLSLYDWIQCTVKKTTAGGKKGAPAHYKFCEGHPLRDSFYVHFESQRIHSVIPTFLGPALPRKDAEDREFYCCAMLTFFVPWRTGLDLKTSDQSWCEAFDSHSVSPRHQKIIDNMHIRYECYDARDDFHAQLKAQARNQDIEDCASGDNLDDEGGELPFDELDAEDLADDAIGQWSRGKLDEMRDVEFMLRKAGWIIGGARNTCTDELFSPEKTMSGSRWKALVTKEKNKILNT
jgi:hypothetical protein